MKLIYPMAYSMIHRIHSNVSNMNVYSSCFFTLNSLYLSTKTDLVYRNSFILLTLSSIIFHQTHNKIVLLFDKLFIYNIIFQGGLRLVYIYHRSMLCTLFILLNFLTTLYLYCYGYKNSEYCFDKNKSTAQIYHAILHACSSVGHLSIIYLLDE